MSERVKRYLGDVLFEELTKTPEFMSKARELVAIDWKTGTESFREYADTLLDGTSISGDLGTYGSLDYPYLERRVMDGALDMHRDPWLWTYDALIGALIPPAVARTALNNIRSQREREEGE
ncbi:hypothetical protein ACFW2V_13540 [Streptomyces sp. NPDC058947]|uniref:hypothetical protein n=1 Tax=Streptomyces sp. NPDC058947 TaxID=3346675 RepID=UPI00367B77E8